MRQSDRLGLSPGLTNKFLSVDFTSYSTSHRPVETRRIRTKGLPHLLTSYKAPQWYPGWLVDIRSELKKTGKAYMKNNTRHKLRDSFLAIRKENSICLLSTREAGYFSP